MTTFRSGGLSQRRMFLVALATSMFVLLLQTIVFAALAFPVDRDYYPFYPSLIKWERTQAAFTEFATCGGCHPQQFNEWCGSVHALAFVDPIYQGELNKGFKAVGHEVTRQCEGCHSPAGMVTGEIKGPGLKFSGANYLLYFLAGEAAKKAGDRELAATLDKKYRMALEKLKATADLEILPVYRNGTLGEIKVRVRNLRAGHNLPTSLTNVRELWLEVTAKDVSGAIVLSSGGFEGPGMLEPETRMFNFEGMGSDFHLAIDPWSMTAFSRHDTIPPRGYKDAWFSVAPAKKQGTVTVEARLKYRPANQQVARRIFRESPRTSAWRTFTAPVP